MGSLHNAFDQRRDSRLRSTYGLSAREYDRMYDLQEGRCAICGSVEPGSGKNCLSVDHDHDTGAIRALLCDSCNNGLGRFREDISVLEEAVAYLKRHRPKE